MRDVDSYTCLLLSSAQVKPCATGEAGDGCERYRARYGVYRDLAESLGPLFARLDRAAH